MQEQSKTRRQFFIATSNGYISSEHVVSITADKNRTNLRTDGGTEYSHNGTVNAPVEKVTAIFKAHGYEFMTEEDVAAFDPLPSTVPRPR